MNCAFGNTFFIYNYIYYYNKLTYKIIIYNINTYYKHDKH